MTSISQPYDEQDSWSEDDGIFDETREDDDLSGIAHSKKIHLNVNPKYGPGWTREHGFRELVQNWRDSIMKTNGMTGDQFRDNLKISRDPGLVEILSFQSHLPTEEPRLFGFIQFKYNKTTLKGVLTMSNFNARLQLWHFLFGGTSKDKDDTQTGQHGEGMKMAILLFRKHPHCHSVRIEASGFSWAFNFDKEKQLVCNVTRISRDRIKKEKRAAIGKSRTTDPHCWSDVTIIVGGPRGGKGQEGVQEKCQKILLGDFENWLELCLDIGNPESVRTKYGELIVQQCYANKLYLRGFHLPTSNIAGKQYRYGYNFASGYTDRERRAIGRPGETWNESDLVNRIWAAVLHTRKEDYIDTYTDMVLETPDKFADVTLIISNYWLDPNVVRMVWEHMRTINANENGQLAFYHAPELGRNEINIVTSNLNMHPYPVHAKLWRILRHYKICRTPQEEQEHRFRNTETVALPDTQFARNLQWMLQCCLGSRPDTIAMAIEYVREQGLGIDVAISGSILRISDRFLTYVASHEGGTCGDPEPSHSMPFTCDHLILELWDNVLSLLPASPQSQANAKDEHRTKSLVAKRVSQIPRMVTCMQTKHRGELLVIWESTESARHNEQPVMVDLHRSECTNFSTSPTTLDEQENGPSCGCLRLLSQVGSCGVTFSNLDVEREYFAMVSRTMNGSFPSMPSIQKSSLAESIESSESEEDIALPELGSGSSTPVTQYRMPEGRRPIFSAAGDSSRNRLFGSQAHASPSSDIAVPTSEDTYTIGTRVDHGQLPWTTGFPGSHDFYLARGHEDNVYIAKPNDGAVNKNGKRPGQPLSVNGTPKKAREIL